jgi:beta-lactam-binding protein with PASTA domain
MTDGNTSIETTPGGRPGRPSRAALITGAVAGVIVLSTVGAVGGWLIADAQQRNDVPSAEGSTTPTYGPEPTTAGTTTRPAPAHTTKTTAATLPDGQFPLPNLVGMDFEEARKTLRAHDLGWQLVFGPAGNGRQVVSTEPRFGQTVKAGTTVKLTVIGAAPAVKVPAVTGLDCEQAKDRLVDAGLSPRYPAEKEGPVLRQDPEAGTERQWNDKVEIYCGKPEDGPGSTDH